MSLTFLVKQKSAVREHKLYTRERERERERKKERKKERERERGSRGTRK